MRGFILAIYENLGPKVARLLKKTRLGKSILRVLSVIERRILMAALPNPVNFDGLSLYWNPGGYWFAEAFASKRYERETYAYLEQTLQPGMTLVDIGAHLGYFSLLAAKKVGSTGHVYAFEPQHDNCEMLGKSVLSNEFQNRVTIVEKAVTDCIGSVDLYYAEPGDGEASIYGRNAEGKDVHRLVETITLDEFFAAEGWPKVDIIKMDIEGAEKLALEGGRELIRRNPQLKMVMEFGPDVQAAAGVSPEELINTLLGVGFTQFSIIESELKPLNMPQDIPLLVETAGGGYVNLLCER